MTGLRLSTLQPQHVQAMLNGMRERGLSPRTCQYARAVLRKALNQALRWGLVTKNAASLAEPPKSERYEIRPLDPAQAGHFLAAARGDRLEALYSVAVTLGLGHGEIFGLRWEDVDLAADTLTVRRQLQRLGGKPRLVDLKTHQSRRTFAIPATVAAHLLAHRTRQLEERLLAGERWRGEEWGLVFASTIGTPLEARNLVRAFKALLKRAGLPDIRFHDLRHSCISLLAAQGVSDRVAMEIAGHSQISLTKNIYTHVYDEAKRQAAGAMDRLLRAG